MKGINTTTEQPWIGLVHVQPKEGVNPLGCGIKGAFAHALALATDATSYETRVLNALDAENLFVIEFKDVATVIRYRRDCRISEDMEDLISSLSNEHPVQFDTFDAYRDHNA